MQKKQALGAKPEKQMVDEQRSPVGTLVAGGGVKRPKVARRRQIDPTTCEREYSADELEFMRALDEYKRVSGRMFPTCSEILEVVRGLGYVRVTEAAESSAATSSSGR